MSNDKLPDAGKPDAGQSSGPNLFLIYGLLGLASVVAILIAIFIVLPSYLHR